LVDVLFIILFLKLFHHFKSFAPFPHQDEDDDDLEHGRFGRFTLGDAAAFRLKSRYARSLAALPHATHGGGGSSVPWLLHARGGAQSWPLSGAATTAAAATTATATGATGAGSPWRPVQAHEVNAVHRVFAVMAELYENMLVAGLVDDAALQLVVHANAAAHHHLQVGVCMCMCHIGLSYHCIPGCSSIPYDFLLLFLPLSS